MSVSIGGRVNSHDIGFGNKCFAFFTALIYAEKNNLYMNNFSMYSLSNVMTVDLNKFNSNKVKEELTEEKVMGKLEYTENDELEYFGRKNYRFCCFFQNANYINRNKEIIFKYVSLKEREMPKSIKNYNINDDDLLCFLRLGDKLYSTPYSETVHPSYYLNIREKYKLKKIYLVIFPSNDKHKQKYIDAMSEIKNNLVILDCGTIKEDFDMIHYFKNIACDTSTFRWWSIFLNNKKNKKIFTPKLFGFLKGLNGQMKSHGTHVKNLPNIKDESTIEDNDFVFLNR